MLSKCSGVGAFPAKQDFRRPRAKKGKKEKRGGGKKGTPPGKSYLPLSDFGEPSATAKRQLSHARGEKETEGRNK